MDVVPGSRMSPSPRSAARISSRENHRTSTISSPSARAADMSAAVAWKPSMSDRG
jgi:hypothetical protein